MANDTLISTEELENHLKDPNWAVVDCRFQLKDPDFGQRAYGQAHIPGAVYAHLDRDLSGPILPGRTGRHPLPAIEAAAGVFSAWGIKRGRTQVVAYDDQGGALAAARLWWMLRWLGHDQVAVLDGGWQKWEKEGRPSRGGSETRPAQFFSPQPRPELAIEADAILRSIGNPDFRLLDARGADRYRGENETIDPVAGHIPGAVSAPYLYNLNPDGTFKPADELRRIYQSVLGNVPAAQSAVYCGSGVTAVHNILAMMHAGLGESRLYPGSWSEWITQPERPISTGTEEGDRRGESRESG